MQSTHPIAVNKRPFAVEPVTGIMLPDGIFDAAIYLLDIACFVTNNSDKDITKNLYVKVWPENDTDWTLSSPRMISIGSLAAGASVLVRWRADFQNSTPGKKRIRIEYGGDFSDDGFDGILPLKTIFVARSSYDLLTDTYSCEVPEGNLTVKFEDTLYSRPFVVRDYSKGEEQVYKIPPIPLPKKISANVVSRPGHENDLPFNDPWWKIVAWLVAVVAAIAAMIAAKEGKGRASIGVNGYGDDNPTEYDWCAPDPEATYGAGGMTTAGILSVISTTAIRVGMMDQIDPWQRGRQETVVKPGELSISERVDAEIEVPKVLTAGAPFSVPINWKYERKTNKGRVLAVSKNEHGENEHLIETVEIDAPKEVSAYDKILVKVRLTDDGGRILVGDEVFGSVVFISPSPKALTFRVPLMDSGNGYDEKANDGWYTAGLNLEEIAAQFGGRNHRGKWRILAYAQNVNDASEAMPPEVAATHVGGNALLSPFSVSLVGSDDTTPQEKSKCQPDRTIEILVR